MDITVWDIYVTRGDGAIMHFDILVLSHLTEEQTIFDIGRQYLRTKPFQTGPLTSNECRICHIEQATEIMILEIEKKGYMIIEMENCDPFD